MSVPRDGEAHERGSPNKAERPHSPMINLELHISTSPLVQSYSPSGEGRQGLSYITSRRVMYTEPSWPSSHEADVASPFSSTVKVGWL